MKLLINKPCTLTYVYRSTPEDFEDNALEEFESFIEQESKILNELGVDHIFINNYTSCNLVLSVQKVLLSEEDMNYLFYSVLNSFDTEYKIQYAGLGGKGCDFCLELV